MKPLANEASKRKNRFQKVLFLDPKLVHRRLRRNIMRPSIMRPSIMLLLLSEILAADQEHDLVGALLQAQLGEDDSVSALGMIVLQASESPSSSSPPPPVTSPGICTSHDVFAAMILAQDITFHPQAQDVVQGDAATQVVVLVVVGALSMCLLIFGSRVANAAVAVAVLLVVFWFTFGIADSATFDSSETPTATMCVRPLIVASITSAVVALLYLCLHLTRCITRSGMSVLMGSCTGAAIVFALNNIIVLGFPGLAFSIGSCIAAVVAGIAFGFLALRMRTYVTAAASLVVGSFGVATSVCSLVPMALPPTNPSASLHTWWAFLGVMVAAALVGSPFHFIRPAPPNQEEEGKKAMSV